MSLPHVILTVLNTREATGYDITKEFSHSIGYFWKASHQQVYRELNKMAEKNEVTCRLEPQDGKPDRKVYAITELGQQALFQWFKEPVKPVTTRDEFSAKLLVCAVHESAPMQAQLIALIDESKTLINHYQELERLHFGQLGLLTRQQRLDRLTLRRGLYNRQAWIQWAQEVLEELQMIDAPNSSVAL
jgi:PadR family transcriptional regulator AphA